ncbi:hypothetical protein [Prevotellamassilia timonensis]|uniref:hypothetical protein n=1 Tax=Prevotellamassilia timonensis TaxID=1852370 RepID=UPI00307F315D
MAALLPLTAAAQSPLESGHSIMVGDDTYDMTDIYQIAFVDKATFGSTSQVTAPSVVKLLKQAPNMRIWAKLLDATGWGAKMVPDAKAEKAFAEKYKAYAGTYPNNTGTRTPFQAYRRQGFTLFAETDEVFNKEWGVPMPVYDEATQSITNWEAIKQVLNEQCGKIYSNLKPGDLTDKENAVNIFVATHLLNSNMQLANNSAVRHATEYGYTTGENINEPSTNYTVNVWDYYRTTWPQESKLLKITQTPDGQFYLNRFSKYDNGLTGTYVETGTLQEGILAHARNEVDNSVYNNVALDGSYHPIDNILSFNSDYASAMKSERVRMDFTTLLPEIASNNLRGKDAYFPTDYFSTLTNVSPDTEIQLLYASKGWVDYQGDELLVTGNYDFTLEVPAMPNDGSYELRMGYSVNEVRAKSLLTFICEDEAGNQGTWGEPLVLDQSEPVMANDGIAQKDADLNYDETLCAENDYALHKLGYMKAPAYFHKAGDSTSPARDELGRSYNGGNMRRVLITSKMSPCKRYYIRFQSLDNSGLAQLHLDFIEFVPRLVDVAGEPYREDVW